MRYLGRCEPALAGAAPKNGLVLKSGIFFEFMRPATSLKANVQRRIFAWADTTVRKTAGCRKRGLRTQAAWEG